MKNLRRQSFVILKRVVANKQALEVVSLPFLLEIRKLNFANSSSSIDCRDLLLLNLSANWAFACRVLWLEIAAKLALFLCLRNEIYYDEWVAGIPTVNLRLVVSMKHILFIYIFLFF
jgi:hypothetical protein